MQEGKSLKTDSGPFWDLIHAERDWAREENIQHWSETAKIPL